MSQPVNDELSRTESGALGHNPNYRILRDQKYEEPMRYLTQEVRLFSNYATLLIYSAFAGYENDAFEPVSHPLAGMGVHLSNFDGLPGGRELLSLFAFARSKRQDALANDEMYKAFEGYANAGFPILLKKLGIEEGKRLSEVRVDELARHLYTLMLQPGGFRL